MNHLLSPNAWVAILSILGSAGIILAVLGTIMEQPAVRTTGFVLILPIVTFGVLLIVVGIPILIVANYRHTQESKSKDDYDGHPDNPTPS